MIGKEISGYKIVDTLGKGGMGEVYLAIKEKIDRKVAIKYLSPEFSNSKETSQRFLNEAKVLSGLSHNNIVGLIDFDEDDNGMYYIMEYVKGESLYDIIYGFDFKKINTNRKINIIKQTLNAFSYMHSKNIIHRDVTIGNIMISEEGIVKILDFGISKDKSDDLNKTKAGSNFGTPYYKSPEQIKGKTDLRSDIYSIGICFYELMTGHCPNKEIQNEFEIYEKIINEPLKPITQFENSKFENGIWKIIQKATSKDPNDRFQNCDEMIKALDSIENNTPPKTILTKNDEEPMSYNNKSKNKKDYSTIIAILLGAIFICSTLYLIKSFDSEEESNSNTDEEVEIVENKKKTRTVNSKIATTIKPDQVVKNFLDALNDGEFKKAYRMQKIKRLGDENHFCSKKGYGGTEEVNVSSISLISKSSSISKVIANYITLDPNNSNWELEREFTLTMINGNWVITDLKNINANSF